jgi:hypothetical protein
MVVCDTLCTEYSYVFRSIALYGAKTRTMWKINQKCLESFEMWWWRRMKKISRTDRVINEGVVKRVKKERNIPHTIKTRKATWICHIMRRNWLLRHIAKGKIEGKTEGMRRRRIRRKKLLDAFKKTRGYWNLKEEAFRKRLCTCRKTKYTISKWTNDWVNKNKRLTDSQVK